MYDSRKSTLYRGGLFVVAVVGLVLGQLFFIDKVARKYRGDYPLRTESIEHKTMNDFMSRRDSIEVLIMGDSHAGESFRHLVLPGFFKTTRPGEDLSSGLVKAKFFLHNSEKIREIMVPLDYHSLNGSFGVPKQEYRIYRYGNVSRVVNGLLSVNPLLDDYNRKLVVRWIFERLNNKLPPTDGDSTPKEEPGFGKINVVSQDFNEHVAKRATSMLSGSVISADSVRAINELADICRSRGIKLSAIRYPLPQTYSNYVEGHGLNMMDEWIVENNELFEHIYDFQDVFEDRLDLFRDPDHLNIPGSNMFTSLFAQEYFMQNSEYLLPRLVKSFPANMPVISIQGQHLSLIAVESAYEFENNGHNSWVWMGGGEVRGIKLVLYAERERVAQLKVAYSSDQTGGVNIKLNGKLVNSQKEAHWQSAKVFLEKGINTLALISLSEIKPKLMLEGADVRELSVRIEQIILD